MDRSSATPRSTLRSIYLDYIGCLNAQDYGRLGLYVDDDAVHNGKRLGLDGYSRLIEDSFSTYSWLHFNVGILVVDEEKHLVSARLILRGTDPNATDVEREHVIYQFRDDKIAEVWSMLEGFEKS